MIVPGKGTNVKWVSEHRKAVIGLVGAVATFAVTTGLADSYPWVGALVAAATAAGVYQVRNGAKPRK